MSTGIAIVTGGGSGIGRAVARALIGDGYDVVVAGRTEEALRATLDGTAGGMAVVADVGDPGSVEALFGRVRERFGRLDLLVNNAGIFGPAMPVEEMPCDAWRSVVDTNLTGSFLCAQAAFRLMREQTPRGGRIINNGSVSSHTPRPNSVAYTATKHAITGLTKSLSLEGRAYGIACGQIDIGNAATDLTEQMSIGVLQADGSTRAEPMMDVRHVADAVVTMAGLPLDANVQFMTIMATAMPFIGRG